MNDIPRGLLFATLLLSANLAAQDPKTILERNCSGCHNAKVRLSGLSLSTREDALRGGRRGPALEGNQSLLLKAIRHETNLRMPPSGKLSPAEIAVLEKWVTAGATWPATIAAGAPNHWSFRAPVTPPLPAVKRVNWVQSPVDRFVLAKLEKENIAPSPVAEKSTLIRRLTLDLTGLLPSPAEVRAFLADSRPDAYNRLAERLLTSPHFGERWGRRWLDYARFAESDGGSRDEPRQIWRYRDYVINAINNDMPFDRFVIEQLAGDLLPNPTPDQLTATGFHRNSPIQIEAGTDREQYRTEAVLDRVDVTGTVFLGLSAGCAKCHDHKFDPISQKEYYSLYAIFNHSDDWGNDRPLFNANTNNLHDVHRPLLEFANPEIVRKRNEVAAAMAKLDEEAEKFRESKEPEAKAELKRLNAEIAKIRKQMPPIETTMIMRELPKPRETFILKGSDYLALGERVSPGVPAFLNPMPAPNPNRLDFARWVTDPANPLLARVTVNRIWQEYFGRGIAETENDFGTQGSPPTHPELLDWLATEFIRSGWSQKAIHRAIVTSATYRQASKVRPDLGERDPRNLLLARQTRLRLDAEIVRDAALSASGMLTPTVGGPSVFPPQPEGAMNASQIKKTWTPSTGPARYRRGMYTFFWRVTPNPGLMVFDEPTGMTACTRRTRSNTPLQALALLNETAFHEFAQGLARRILAAPAASRPGLAFELTTSRTPAPAELARLNNLLAAERDALLTNPAEAETLAGPAAAANKVEFATWVSVARVLLNTDEFMTRD